MIFRTSFVAMAITLASCSTSSTSNKTSTTTQKTASSPVSKPATNSTKKADIVENSNVFFVRDNTYFMLIYSATIKIDGKKVAKLKPDQFSAINLAPGEYEVKISFPLIAGLPSKKRKLRIKKGQKAHFGILKTKHLGMAEGWLKTDRALESDPMDLVKCCEYVPPLVE